MKERVSTQQPPKGIVSSEDKDDMILTPSRERWVVAVHEAGHAVIAEKVGFSVKEEVRIENAYKCCVRPDWQIDILPNGISSETADEVDSDALFALAGGKAEICDPTGQGVAEFTSKDDEYFENLKPGYDRPALVPDWRKRMHARAEALVRKHWETIEMVARALYESKSGRLSGAKVRQIIKR